MSGNYNITVTVKINPKLSAGKALAQIGAVFNKYNLAYPFDYRFVDREYVKKFRDEEQIGKQAGFFSALAIFISCLGLFGMASFMAEQRAKEIGIRKVLGASVFTLWRLLSRDSMVLVIISLVIAVPAAYYFMYHWLGHYYYRSAISWRIFAFAGGGALGITLLTISYQTITAALRNPVKSLRSD